MDTLASITRERRDVTYNIDSNALMSTSGSNLSSTIPPEFIQKKLPQTQPINVPKVDKEAPRSKEITQDTNNRASGEMGTETPSSFTDDSFGMMQAEDEQKDSLRDDGKSENTTTTTTTRSSSLEDPPKAPIEEVKEFLPTNIKTENSVTPDLSKCQLDNINKFWRDAQEYAKSARELYQGNAIPTQEKANQTLEKYEKMLASAANVSELIRLVAKEPQFKQQKFDFFRVLRQGLAKTVLCTPKINKLLDKVSSSLKDLIVLDLKNLRDEKRVEKLVDLSEEEYSFERKYIRRKTPLELQCREIHILSSYRETLLDLERILKHKAVDDRSPKVTEKASQRQKDLLDDICEHLNGVVKAFKKIDPLEHQLHSVYPEINNNYRPENTVTYLKKIYEAVAEVIRTQLLDIYWIKGNRKCLQEFIASHCAELRAAGKPQDFTKDGALAEFERSLDSQKYDREFLNFWTSMIQNGLPCYITIDPETSKKVFLLKSKKIVLPDHPSEEQLTAYKKDLKGFIADSTVHLSNFAFKDPEFLDIFFLCLHELRLKYSADSEEPKNELEIHARNFQFLERLQDKEHNENILIEFNEKLKEKKASVVKRLEQKAKEQAEKNPDEQSEILLPVELAINFMLRFYRAVNHKYIITPVKNLKLLFRLAYPHFDRGKLITGIAETSSDYEKSLEQHFLEGTQRLFFYLKREAHFEIQAIRADEIYPGDGITGTYAYLYTTTTVKEPYPGESRLENPISIAFSYEIVGDENSVDPKVMQALSTVKEKIRLARLILNAAGYTSFVERSSNENKKKFRKSDGT